MPKYDHMTLHRGPCPCGEGEVEVTYHSPEKMYVKAYFEEHLRCGKCSDEYDVGHPKAIEFGKVGAYEVWFTPKGAPSGPRVPAARSSSDE